MKRIGPGCMAIVLVLAAVACTGEGGRENRAGGDTAPESPFRQWVRFQYIKRLILPPRILAYWEGFMQEAWTDGRTAFLANGPYVDVIDVAPGHSLYRIARVHVDGLALALEGTGDVLVVAVGDTGVVTMDVRDPRRPRILDRFSPEGFAQGVSVEGSRAAIAMKGGGVWVLDISDPSKIVAMAHLPVPHANDVAWDGNMLYVADGREGIIVARVDPAGKWERLGAVDVTYERRPSPLDPGPLSVLPVGKRLIVSCGLRGVVLVDVEDPTEPRVIWAEETGGSVYHAEAEGGEVHVADLAKGLLHYRWDGMNRLQRMGSISVNGAPVHVQAVARRLFVTGAGGTYSIYGRAAMDRRGREDRIGHYGLVPELEGHAPSWPESDVTEHVPPGMTTDGRTVLREGVGDPGWTRAGEYTESPSARRIRALDEGATMEGLSPELSADARKASELFAEGAIVASGSGGLWKLGRNAQGKWSLLRMLDTPGFALGVEAHPGETWLADGPGGIRRLEPASASGLGEPIALEKLPWDVRIVSGALYAAGLDDGLMVYALRPDAAPSAKNQPRLGRGTGGSGDRLSIAAPLFVETHPVGQFAIRLVEGSGEVFVVDLADGVHRFDVSDPLHPRRLDHYGKWVLDAAVHGQDLYVGSYREGVEVYRIGEAEKPRLTLRGPKTPYGVEISGSTLAVADYRGGVWLYEIREGDRPRLVRRFRTAGEAYDVDLAGGYVYVADGRAGVQVIHPETGETVQVPFERPLP